MAEANHYSRSSITQQTMQSVHVLDWLDWICLTTIHVLQDILAVPCMCVWPTRHGWCSGSGDVLPFILPLSGTAHLPTSFKHQRVHNQETLWHSWLCLFVVRCQLREQSSIWTKSTMSVSLLKYWIGLHLFNDDTCSSKHISCPSQVGFSHNCLRYEQIT